MFGLAKAHHVGQVQISRFLTPLRGLVEFSGVHASLGLFLSTCILGRYDSEK